MARGRPAGPAASSSRRYTAQDRRLAAVLAEQAAIAVTAALRHYDEATPSDNLRIALSSRSAIDQAIGIIIGPLRRDRELHRAGVHRQRHDPRNRRAGRRALGAVHPGPGEGNPGTRAGQVEDIAHAVSYFVDQRSGDATTPWQSTRWPLSSTSPQAGLSSACFRGKQVARSPPQRPTTRQPHRDNATTTLSRTWWTGQRHHAATHAGYGQSIPRRPVAAQWSTSMLPRGVKVAPASCRPIRASRH